MSFLKKLFKKEKPIETYKDFWDWFLIHEKKFFKVVKQGGNNEITTDFFDQIAPKLDELKEDIWYLTGMLDDTTADLILTPDGDLKNFYIIEELIAAAPKINRWKFRAHKPEHNIEDVSIEMYGHTFNRKNLFFYSNDLKAYPDEIDITIIHNDYSEENKSKIINGIYIFLDNYLGELTTTTVIDNITFLSNNDAKKELVPIDKLSAFLSWREKEFIEKYDGFRYNTDDDRYISLETTLKNGNPLVAIMNSDLLEWEATASHPWILNIQVPYDGEENNGMPEDEIYQLLNKIEEDVAEELKDFDGYLNIGRETGDNIREVFFACKDFRKPCKVLDKIKIKYSHKIEVDYKINKDKYWQCFNWHRKGISKNPK